MSMAGLRGNTGKVKKRACVCGHGVSIHRQEKRKGQKTFPCARLACDCKNYLERARNRFAVESQEQLVRKAVEAL